MRRIARALFATFVLAMLLSSSLPVMAESATPIDPEQVQRIIHDYLLAHPEVVIEALQAAEARLKEKEAEATRAAIVAHRDELLHDPSSPIGGNPKGDVTLVEFFDYRCPYCKATEPSLEALIKEDGKLRVVYKEFPILGPVSVFASHVGIAAQKQGKYLAFHNRMMALRGTIDDAAVMKVAEDSGLDIVRLKKDMASADINNIIQRDYALASVLGINATPGFVTGEHVTMGALSIDGLRKLIAAARESKKTP